MAKQQFKAPLEKLSAAKLKAVRGKRLNLKPLLGKWHNCDRKTGGLVRVEISRRRGVLIVHPFGACHPQPCDWGAVKGRAYSESVSSVDAVAFTATFKFSFKVTIVTGHLCEGCLLVETYNHFTDGSGRCDYYSRDCFCRH
jgi:hypothetical protein